MKYALFALVAVLATGCASYKQPPTLAVEKIPADKIRFAKSAVSASELNAKSFETVARASNEQCVRKGSRIPFVTYTNPAIRNDDNLRAAYAHAGWVGPPRLVATHASAASVDGKYIASVGGKKIEPGEAYIAYTSAYDLAKDKKPIPVTFTDGTSTTFAHYEGCMGLAMVEPTDPDKFAKNSGFSLEVLPLAWGLVPENEDERLFLMGRALYFVSGPGAGPLESSALAGKVAGGFVKGLTFGLGTMVYNPATTIYSVTRARMVGDADVFGFHAAVRAGADPKRILNFALNNAAKAPYGIEELLFSAERVEAIRKLANGATDVATAK